MEFAIWRPPADVLHYGKRWIIKLEIAGMCRDEMEIAARGHSLHIRGCRRDMLLEQGYYYHSLEISYSKFERFIELPFSIDPDNIRWDYHDGMLIIQLNSLNKEDAS